MSPPRYAALVLAGRRVAVDPLARARGVSHRALLPVAGVPMLVRVCAALREARSVEGVCVSIDAPEVLEREPSLAATLADGSLTVHASLDSPARSVADALGRGEPRPTLVTTADHALLTGARVDGFLEASERSGADLAVGVVEAAAFGGDDALGARTWTRLRDGAYTGANLFAFRTPRARGAAEFFARAEAHRKRPWRLLGALGPGLGLAYLAGLLRLEDAFERVSERAGARLRPVLLDELEAAVDVDGARDLELAERLLRDQETSDTPSAGPHQTKPPLAGS